jgi:hypothetical protein
MKMDARLRRARNFPASLAPALVLVAAGVLAGLSAFLVGTAEIRWLVALAAGLVAIALALSLTRSAWASFAIGCAFLGIVQARRHILSGRKMALLGVCAFLAAQTMDSERHPGGGGGGGFGL